MKLILTKKKCSNKFTLICAVYFKFIQLERGRELAKMDEESEAEFREGLGAGESSLEKMIRISYELLGLISFLTVGEDEVRAWEIKRDTVAQKAAGKIHTDIERGFIRAEVVHYSDLLSCGSIAECKKNALLRTEGKDYVVKDGDVMNMLFNV